MVVWLLVQMDDENSGVVGGGVGSNIFYWCF